MYAPRFAILRVLAILLIAIVALAACAPAPTATPVPTPVPPTKAAAPTTVPPTSAPTAAPTAVPPTATTVPTAAPTAKPVALKVVTNDKFGKIIADGDGRTLYLFTKDTKDTSNCYDDCAKNWPPLIGDKPTLGDGVDAKLVGSTKRKDGTTQVTYNSWPLYYWFADKNPGDTLGQAIGDVWWVITPTGDGITSAAAPAITINLGAGRDGDQPGTAKLTARGDKTQVDLNIKPGAAGAAQPVHVHEGGCPAPGAVKFPLKDIVDGKSSTTIDAPLSALLTGGFAINAHLSAADVNKYVACGVIPQAAIQILDPGRDGNQAGIAILVAQDTKTQVNLFIKPLPGATQPVHIHEGACPAPGAVKFPLKDIVDGKSTTVVDAKLSDLLAGGFAINAHLSADKIDKYVACGNLKAPKVAALKLVSNDKLGKFIADGDGNSLYVYAHDAKGVSNCYEGCARAWPPLLTTDTAKLGDGLDAKLLGTTVRKEGTIQVTYNSWPLYYWFQDKKPGDTLGQRVGDVWWVETAAGEAVTEAPDPAITIQLGAGRDGDQSGTAKLTAKGDKTQVDLSIKPGAAGAAQPVHIHEGACPAPGAVKFPLKDIVDGKSTTTVDAKLGDLLTGGFAINAHLSAADIGKYVACGNIPQGAVEALGAGRDASQPGAAVLVSQGAKTEVDVFIKPIMGAGLTQPVHIHEGACPAPGAVKFPLKDIADGKSTTVVDAALADLLKGGFAINAHLSKDDINKYVACGNVK